ncbi:MAG: glutamate--cysteine ligase [Thermoleophilia bacterium]|nr:glutamate--cysteine ligase [Thermoleophilia bacterium]
MSNARRRLWAEHSVEGSLSVEGEFFLVDLHSGACAAAAESVVQHCEFAEREIVQEVVETSTGPHTRTEALLEGMTLRRDALTVSARRTGHGILASGTHPLCNTQALTLTDDDRYRRVRQELPWIWRETHTCGMRVHVGITSADRAIRICDSLRRWLPTLLALSANSPLWRGEDTGLASMRALLIQGHPRSGMPPCWESWNRYLELTDTVTDLAFGDQSWFWWFTKPHPTHGTVEVRICDAQTDVRDAWALASLTGALCAALGHGQLSSGWADDPAELLLEESMWNAIRTGIGGQCLLTIDPCTFGEHALKLVDDLSPSLSAACIQRLRALASAPGHSAQVAELERLGDPLSVALSLGAQSAGGDGFLVPAPWVVLPQLEGSM